MPSHATELKALYTCEVLIKKNKNQMQKSGDVAYTPPTKIPTNQLDENKYFHQELDFRFFLLLFSHSIN